MIAQINADSQFYRERFAVKMIWPNEKLLLCWCQNKNEPEPAYDEFPMQMYDVHIDIDISIKCIVDEWTLQDTHATIHGKYNE